MVACMIGPLDRSACTATVLAHGAVLGLALPHRHPSCPAAPQTGTSRTILHPGQCSTSPSQPGAALRLMAPPLFQLSCTPVYAALCPAALRARHLSVCALRLPVARRSAYRARKGWIGARTESPGDRLRQGARLPERPLFCSAAQARVRLQRSRAWRSKRASSAGREAWLGLGRSLRRWSRSAWAAPSWTSNVRAATPPSAHTNRTAARACTRAGGGACGAPAPSARRTRARRAHTARAPAPRAAGNEIGDQAALAAIESILEANKARPPASVRPAFASGRDPNP